jgi:hypothetical protein
MEGEILPMYRIWTGGEISPIHWVKYRGNDLMIGQQSIFVRGIAHPQIQVESF